MNVWNRFMTSLQAGIAAWRDTAFMPQDDDWDSWENRATRYQHGLALYNNQQYTQIANQMAMSMKQQHNLYRHTRGIFNPTYRTVEGFVSAVYGGEIKRSLRGSSFYAETDDDTLRDNIWQIIQWSNWQQNKSLYVRTGAMYGDVGLKVVDDPDRQKTYLEVIDPRKIYDVEVDNVGNVKRVVIQYMRGEVVDGKESSYLYTEIIDKEQFQTFKDGKLFAFVEDANGNSVPEWDNIYGFVPFALTNHMDIGQTFGAMAIHSQVHKINNINDQASLIADNIRNAVQVMYHAKGVQKGQLATNSDEPNRDDVRLLYTNEDAEMIPLSPNIDISGAGENLERMIADAEKDIPILALHKIRDGGNITAPGVVSGFSDAINQIKDVQSNYDHSAIKGIQMCLTIAGIRKYGGIPYNINSFTNGDMEFSIRQREPIKSELSKLERVQTLSALDPENPLTHLILEEMGYESDAIDDAVARAEAAKADRLRELAMQNKVAGLSALAMQGRQLRNGQPAGQPQLPAGNEAPVDDGNAIVIGGNA